MIVQSGFVEGRNVVFEYPDCNISEGNSSEIMADGNPDHWPAVVDEII
jgi:hypothetical protein